MTEPLFNSSWYRVADLRPRLAPHLRVVRQPVRDQVWQVLSEPASGRQLRLNPPAWAFAGRMDGTQTVESLWQLLVAQMGDLTPSQGDILRLLTQLYRAGMVQFDAAPHLSMLFTQRGADRRARARAWINPLALRMRLIDPTRMLDRLVPLGRWLFSPAVGLVWLGVVVLAGLACLVNLGALKADTVVLASSTRGLWLAWLSYPVIKALHEFGHAMAVRRCGGAVHDMGVTLLFFTPAPYVDASAANGFERRRDRALVSSAGILVELALAAIAVGVWLAVQPGLVRDLSLTVLLICTLSTLVFNGNPLLRLDGYHVMADTLNLPNLAARSNAWWASLAMRSLHGLDAPPPVVLAAGERKWLMAYAPLSWGYRIVLLAALVGWVGAQSWLLGWLMAAAFTLWMGWQVGAWLMLVAGAGPARRRAALALAGVCVAVAVLLLGVPAPAVVVARGVVWPPDGAQLRPEVAGFVQATPVVDGARVTRGEVLLTLDDPALVAERERRTSELAGLQARQYQALLAEPARAVSLADDIERSEAEIARADEQLARLSMRGGMDGVLVLPRPADLPGSYVARGAMLGYILNEAPANVRAVLDEQDVLRVRNRIRAVEVRLADQPANPLAAMVTRETPGGVRALPSAALGQGRGGTIAVDPADKDGLRTLAPVFMMDVALPQQAAGLVGARAWVRFDLGYEPLAWQWGRRLQQLLLRQFNPVGQA
ncbi:MAG: hypothetical protein KIS62_12710 [Ramlibacter sp.]|nr:hypothetical protein [Ramlibacter sp.]